MHCGRLMKRCPSELLVSRRRLPRGDADAQGYLDSFAHEMY
jgi:hypothetical protein